MEYFDMRKMSVNLWRNAAGETREICSTGKNIDFTSVHSIASIAANGEFLCFQHGKDSDVAGRRRDAP